MRKSRFTDEQMVAILRESDRTSVAEAAKKHKVSDQTIYLWRKHFAGLAPADVKRLKALELENAKLKRLLAERDLEVDLMREVNRKNVWSAPRLQAQSVDEDSLHKCIRPLSSELRLQPGHDEIRAQRS